MIYLVVPIKLYVCTSAVNYRFVLFVHIIEVAPLLLHLGSPGGGILVNQHDAHILFSRHTARCVPRHAPHDVPCD